MESTEIDENEQMASNGVSNEDSRETCFNEVFELSSSREVLCPPTEQQDNKKRCSKRTKIIAVQLAVVFSVLAVIFSIGLYFTATKSSKSSQNIPEDIPVNEYNSSLLSYFGPIHYDVFLNIDLDRIDANDINASFQGNVAMWIMCISSTNQIILNSDVFIDSHSVSVKQDDFDGKALNVTNIVEDRLREIVIISLEKSVENSTVLYLTMSFKSLMNHEDKHGLSLVHYTDDNGITKKMAVSSLSPSYTRRLFPCLDEPKKKATFNLTVRRPPGYVALSNTPLFKFGELESGYNFDTFAKTPKMAPHALSLVVAQLNYTKVVWNGLVIKLWARNGLLPSFEFAAAMVAPSVEALENYTGIIYPLPKLDIIAVPDNTLRRADNWGCVITNEKLLLFNSNYSIVHDAVNVDVNVALMVSHQWFGNLVSCETWQDLWLQEGLATFFAFTALNFINKDGKMYEIFVSKIESAMEEDAMLFKTLYEETVDYFEDISSIFAIKSAALVRMTRFFVTEPSFQLSIRDLLSSNAHGTISADDFYEALENYEDLSLYKRPANISRILRSWVENPSYPIIFVHRNDSKYHLYQKPFRFDLGIPDDRSSAQSSYKWIIPVTHRILFSKPGWEMNWLEENSAELPGKYNKTSLAILNTLEQGCYRVCYDNIIWEDFLSALFYNISVFHVETRAGLISDLFALARARLLDETLVLRFISFLEYEKEFLPWQTFLQDSALSFDFYDRMFFSTHLYPKFLKYIRKLVAPIFTALHASVIPEKEYSKRLLKFEVIKLACHVGIEACTKSAAGLFQFYMVGPYSNKIVPDIRKTVFCQGIKLGGDLEWQTAYGIWNSTREMKFSDHKLWAYALGCTKDMRKLRQYMKSLIEVGDFDALQTLISQVKSLHRILPLLQRYWSDIRKTFGAQRKEILKNVALSVVTIDGLIKLGKWLDPLTERGEDPSIISVATPIAEENLNWMKRNYRNISEWLHKQNFTTHSLT